MSVDFYPCSRCEETYRDCGCYVRCDESAGGCGRAWCSDFCAEQDGYVRCHCKLEKDINSHEGYCEDGCDKYNDEYDSCSSVNCEHYIEASCSYCRGEMFEDEELLDYALKLLNMSKEQLIDNIRINN